MRIRTMEGVGKIAARIISAALDAPACAGASTGAREARACWTLAVDRRILRGPARPFSAEATRGRTRRCEGPPKRVQARRL
jgi:hypothetical protein